MRASSLYRTNKMKSFQIRFHTLCVYLQTAQMSVISPDDHIIKPIELDHFSVCLFFSLLSNIFYVYSEFLNLVRFPNALSKLKKKNYGFFFGQIYWSHHLFFRTHGWLLNLLLSLSCRFFYSTSILLYFTQTLFCSPFISIWSRFCSFFAFFNFKYRLKTFALHVGSRNNNNNNIIIVKMHMQFNQIFIKWLAWYESLCVFVFGRE